MPVLGMMKDEEGCDGWCVEYLFIQRNDFDKDVSVLLVFRFDMMDLMINSLLWGESDYYFWICKRKMKAL